MQFRITVLTSLAAFLMTFLTACGPDTVGTAVVLWPAEGWPVDPGAVVPVLEVSDLDDTYTLRPAAADRELSSPTWRVRFFETAEEAQAYAEEFSPYAEQFGRIVGRPDNLGAQRVYRSAQARSEQTVYRLRDNERFKIVDRSDEPTDESGATAHWYQILTRDGTVGWVFGYYLQIDGAETAANGTRDESNDELRQVLAQVWRPSYFQDMINSGRYDLDRFRQQYGLFPNPQENSLRLRVPDHETTFSYTSVFPGSRGTYVFEGSSLQLTVRDQRRISIQYEYRGDIYSRALVTLREELQSVINRENRRREERYQEILDRGNTLLSTAYGSIRLHEDMVFEWQGYGRLVPSLVPSDAGNRGVLQFSYYLGEDIANEFDGVLAFHFEGRNSDEAIVFLYRFSNGGIRLSQVGERNIDQNLVQEASVSPLIIFFSFDRQSRPEERSSE